MMLMFSSVHGSSDTGRRLELAGPHDAVGNKLSDGGKLDEPTRIQVKPAFFSYLVTTKILCVHVAC